MKDLLTIEFNGGEFMPESGSLVRGQWDVGAAGGIFMVVLLGEVGNFDFDFKVIVHFF